MTLAQPLASLPPPDPWTADGSALFLDLDGTLAAIEARPQDVMPQPWRSHLLARLEKRLGGRLAVISGRTLEDVDRILDGSVRAVAAVHGLFVRRPDGVVESAQAGSGMDAARTRFQALADAHPSLLLEDKGVSLALHYRQAPLLGAVVCAAAEELAAQAELRLQRGQMVAEVCTPGFDKASAVRSFMRMPPFAGAAPVFVGDDLTDEAGFTAAQAMDGCGVLVGPGRETAARRRLADVEAVRNWLEQGLDG